MSKIRVTNFLAAFFQNLNELVYLRAFAPKGAPSDDPNFKAVKLRVSRHELQTDRMLQRQLRQLKTTRGIYFVVNSGGDTDADISRFNAWFAEDDSRPIEEQHRALDAAPLPPSIRVETHKSVHAYWLIDGQCGEEEWRDIQERLISYFGGDEKIKNPSRVMRLPYFHHVRYDVETGDLSFKRVELAEFNPQLRYSVEAMKEAFPPRDEAVQAAASATALESPSTFTTWEELNAEAGRRIRLLPKARTNSKEWTHAPGICQGSTEGTAIAVSPGGPYTCHKGCSTAQLLAALGLPERPNTQDRDVSVGDAQTRAARASGFSFTTIKELVNEPEEEVAYVWERTLPRGGFSICAAKPKVGKSTLIRNLAVAVSRGEDFFGRATAQGKVIYLCLEEKRAEIAAHFRRMGVSDEDIIIHTGRTPSDARIALEAAIEEHKPALVIIDPLARFSNIKEFNDYGQVTRGLAPLIDIARESDCQTHILAVHHNGKSEREGGDALLGSTAFFGTVDTLLTMKRREKLRTIETVQRYGEAMPETVVNLDSETGVTMPGGDVQAILLDAQKSKVLESMGDEYLSENDIKGNVSGNLGLTSKAIRALHEEGRLERTGTGKKGDPYLYRKRSGVSQ